MNQILDMPGASQVRSQLCTEEKLEGLRSAFHSEILGNPLARLNTEMSM